MPKCYVRAGRLAALTLLRWVGCLERALRNNATALVVDDDMVLRGALAELLEEEGFLNVIQASNGFSGLRLAFEHHPQVVLLDLMLPELSGAEVLRELRNGPGGA